MTISPKSIFKFNFNINSTQDVETAYYHWPEAQEIYHKIAANSRTSFEQITKDFNLNYLYKDSQFKDLSFEFCQEILFDINNYQFLLEDYQEISNQLADRINLALKGHEMALSYYSKGDYTSASKAMEQIKLYAIVIAQTLDNFAKEVESLRKDVKDTIESKTRDCGLIYRQVNQLVNRSRFSKYPEGKRITDSKVKKLLKLNGLEQYKSLGPKLIEVREALLNVHIFLRNAQQIAVSLIFQDFNGNQPSPKAVDAFQTFQSLIKTLSNCKRMTVSDAVKNMKTGKVALHSPIIKYDEPNNEDYEKKFKSSYSKFLALAKLNIDLASIMQLAAQELKANRVETPDVEEEPLESPSPSSSNDS